MDPMVAYLNALIYLTLAALISAGVVAAGSLLGPKRPRKAKLEPYESGLTPAGFVRRLPAHFYAVGMLFLIFDVEVAFLWPYAVNAGKLGLAGFWAVTGFTVVVMLGFLYEWLKGVMRWD